MAVVKLNDLKPGMKLTEPVFNINGNLLLREGVELTARHISILKAWGVSQVEVDSQEKTDQRKPELNPQVLCALQERLRTKFFGVLNNEIMREIMRVAEKQAIRKLMLASTRESRG